MFGGLFRKREAERRRIFRYFDGDRERGVDPLQALISLRSHATFRWDEHLAQVSLGDPEATAITVRAIRDVFELPPYSDRDGDSGVTDEEALETFAAFVEFLEDSKKNISLRPTWRPSTDSTRPFDPDLLTPSNSDCGSTCRVNGCDRPTA